MKERVLKTFVSALLLTVLLFASVVAIDQSLASPQPRVMVMPDFIDVGVEETFFIDIIAEDVEALYTLEFMLNWNPELLDLIEIVEGEFLRIGAEDSTFFLNHTLQDQGLVHVVCTLLGDIPSRNGSGILASLVFLAISPGESLMDLSETGFDEYDGSVIVHEAVSESLTESNRESLIVTQESVSTATASDPLWTVRDPAGIGWPAGADFPTLQAAINCPAVANGDTIHVFAGVDPTTFVWKSLKIIGEGVGVTTVNGLGALGLIIAANDVFITELTITGATAGIVCLPATVGIIISNNVIANNRVGIALWRSIQNEIKGNFPITGNLCGVLMLWGSNALVKANNMTNNLIVGAQIVSIIGAPVTGDFYWNNFMGNTLHVWPPLGGAPLVLWDDGSSKGNFWQPPAPPCPADGWPLAVPWWWCPGDINLDCVVNILDVSSAALAFGSYYSHVRWNPKADVDNNNVVNIIDIAAIARWFGWKDP